MVGKLPGINFQLKSQYLSPQALLLRIYPLSSLFLDNKGGVEK